MSERVSQRVYVTYILSWLYRTYKYSFSFIIRYLFLLSFLFLILLRCDYWRCVTLSSHRRRRRLVSIWLDSFASELLFSFHPADMAGCLILISTFVSAVGEKERIYKFPTSTEIGYIDTPSFSFLFFFTSRITFYSLCHRREMFRNPLFSFSHPWISLISLWNIVYIIELIYVYTSKFINTSQPHTHGLAFLNKRMLYSDVYLTASIHLRFMLFYISIPIIRLARSVSI